MPSRAQIMLMAVGFGKKPVKNMRSGFRLKVSSASSASWVGVGSAAPHNCRRTPRRTKASVRCLSEPVANPHQADEVIWKLRNNDVLKHLKTADTSELKTNEWRSWLPTTSANLWHWYKLIHREQPYTSLQWAAAASRDTWNRSAFIQPYRQHQTRGKEIPLLRFPSPGKQFRPSWICVSFLKL